MWETLWSVALWISKIQIDTIIKLKSKTILNTKLIQINKLNKILKTKKKQIDTPMNASGQGINNDILLFKINNSTIIINNRNNQQYKHV